MSRYKANFLWPHAAGSIEEAGYEFANGSTAEYQKSWWHILLILARHETCICAAIKTPCNQIIKGHRHHDCIAIIQASGIGELDSEKKGIQGFVTSTGRFVTRSEGYELQIAAGIESIADGGYRGNKLYSDDLY